MLTPGNTTNVTSIPNKTCRRLALDSLNAFLVLFQLNLAVSDTVITIVS